MATQNIDTLELISTVGEIYDTIASIIRECNGLEDQLNNISNTSVCTNADSTVATAWLNLKDMSVQIDSLYKNYADDLKTEIDNFARGAQSSNEAEASAQERTSNVFKEQQDAISKLKNRI